ncbi:hypothetical protein SY85_14910 [Flavisolibacter tropicus]|uniref:Uncharacterized protein n=1 Tax=Flavisolibacter tropicus TaxID=1492898 RepID=A0A172TXA1_9BACT|nr:hypothetical protein SY85_14910 [Flavisolibacter tropicus]
MAYLQLQLLTVHYLFTQALNYTKRGITKDRWIENERMKREACNLKLCVGVPYAILQGVLSIILFI